MKPGAASLSEARRGFTLAITLTEIALLLFFILLVLVTDLEVSSESLGGENEFLQAEIERQDDQIDTLLQVKKELEQAYPRAFSGSSSSAGSTPGLDDNDEFLHLVRQLGRDARRGRELSEQLSRLEEARQELATQLEQRTATAEDAVSRAAQLEQQLSFVTSRSGPIGFGPPPCWLSPSNGEVEYLFNVTIGETSLTVTPAWPASREQDALQIPGIRDWPAGETSLAEFRQRAAPVLAWCKQQQPACRLYVRIYDKAESKQAFKRHLLGIEDYFYKWLSPS